MDRLSGKLLLAQKFDPSVNWASSINMKTGYPERVVKYSPEYDGEDMITTDICPAALGSKNQQPAAYSPLTGLYYVPTNHLCMDYEPFEVEYVSDRPHVGASLNMYPAPVGTHLGNFIA
jgi:glucose dehydrogenase